MGVATGDLPCAGVRSEQELQVTGARGKVLQAEGGNRTKTLGWEGAQRT